MDKQRYPDHQGHSDGSFVGQLGKFDVHADLTKTGKPEVRLVYGKNEHNVTAIKGCGLMDLRLLAGKLIDEHHRALRQAKT